MHKQNENGLTFPEWFNAAGFEGQFNLQQYEAWKRGEDPAEYRAEKNPKSI